MCGILGTSRPVGRQRFAEALERLGHRGPDGTGIAQVGDVLLGHKRLAIIDPDAHSNQPMRGGRDGRWICVFNGEIYNYIEIREQLEARGYGFQTDSDTEVLINAFDCFGEAALGKFIGMFAFCLHDSFTGRMILARDRFGVKPLYLTDAGPLVFASEPKAILHLLPSVPDVSLVAVSSYLSYRYPIDGSSFFRGISQLPPGHLLRVNAGGERELVRYYSLADEIGRERFARPMDYSAAIRGSLESSVRYRMIADVPVGAYLSGGVDSGAIVATMASMSSTPVKTFTIGFEDEGFDEFDQARLVARLFGTDHHEILMGSQDYMELMWQLIGIKDAPLGVPNEVPLYVMSKALREEVTVVLSGEGADEIFGGYGRIFRSADDLQRLNELATGAIDPNSVFGVRLRQKYGATLPLDKPTHFNSLYAYTSSTCKESLLGPQFAALELESTFVDLFASVMAEVADYDYATQMMYVFERLHLPGLLQRVDAMTMGTSVEARVPFVDHRLVELAFRLPIEEKLKWRPGARPSNYLGSEASEVLDIPKAALKEAFRGVLPGEILERRKMGFPVPLHRWFDGELGRLARSQLSNGTLAAMDLIDEAAVLSLVEGRTGVVDHRSAMTVWMLLNLELFLRRYYS